MKLRTSLSVMILCLIFSFSHTSLFASIDRPPKKEIRKKRKLEQRQQRSKFKAKRQQFRSQLKGMNKSEKRAFLLKKINGADSHAFGTTMAYLGVTFLIVGMLLALIFGGFIGTLGGIIAAVGLILVIVWLINRLAYL